MLHTGPKKGVEYITLKPEDRARVLLPLAESNAVVFDTETTGLHVRSRPSQDECVCIGLCFVDLVEDESTRVIVLPWDDGVKALVHEILDRAKAVVAHNLRFDTHAIDYDLPVEPKLEQKFIDTQMLWYFQDTGARKSLDDLAPMFGYHNKLPTPKEIKRGLIREMDPREVYEYLADDVEATAKIYLALRKRHRVTPWLGRVDMPLEGVVQRMEQRGVMIDVPLLENALSIAKSEIKGLEEEMSYVAGDINFGSSKQLGELFKRRGWPCGVTKTGQPSVTAEILDGLAPRLPFAEDLRKWRKFSKLKSAFFEPLLQMAARGNGLVHASFNTMATKTGRFSCSDPNLQQAVNAREGAVSVASAVRASITHEDGVSAADYSQIEYRLAAAMAEEDALLDAFNSGGDPHSATAAKMFKVPLDQVSKLQRFRAKAVNFGTLFGMTPGGLMHQLKCSYAEASEFFDRHQQALPKLAAWTQERKQTYSAEMQASTRSGRTIRYTEYDNTDPGLSVEVQGTASEMMRAALVGLEQADLEPIITVHDEAVCKGRGKAEAMAEVMQEAAEKAFPELAAMVRFPLDASDGDNWAEAH